MSGGLTIMTVLLISLGGEPEQSSTVALVADSSGRSYGADHGLTLYFDGDAATEGYESDLMARMDYLRGHPYDLNTVTLEELQSIPGLLPTDASAVIAQRRSLKYYASMTQLLSLEEGGERILYQLLPFVTVGPRHGETGRVQFRSRVRSDRRLPSLERPDLGSPFGFLERLSLRPSELVALGMVLEKDAGERTSDGFISGYIEARDQTFGAQVLLGDYVVESGQGLVFWRNRFSPKGSNSPVTMRRLTLGIRPRASAAGGGYLRGVAVSISGVGNGRVTCSLFASRRSLDGTVDENGTLTSLDETGLFRTEQELRKRNVASERLIGGRAAWSVAEGVLAGISFSRFWFDRPVMTDRRLGETRTSAGAIGMDAMVGFGRIQLFGEAAHSGGVAILIGTSINISRTAGVVMVWREYQPGFANPHASGFGESPETRNERGFYIGWEIPIGGLTTVTGSYDQYRFPGGTYATTLPVGGNDLAIRVDAKLSGKATLSVRAARRRTVGIEPDMNQTDRASALLGERTSHRVRVTLDVHAGRRVELTTRGEMRNISLGGMKEGGGLLSQEVRIRPTAGLSLSARLVAFQAGMGGTPLSQQEEDVPGAYSNPSLSGSGRRWYVLVHWETVSWLELSVKYALGESLTTGSDRPGSSMTVCTSSCSVQLDIRL